MSRTFVTDRDLGHRFPTILREGGIRVERHDDHFGPTTPDEVWIPFVAGSRWKAVTHNKRIRYTPNELALVMGSRLGMIVVVGTAKLPNLAENFVRSIDRIERYLRDQAPPFIAKVYRPSPRRRGSQPVSARSNRAFGYPRILIRLSQSGRRGRR